MKPYVKAGLIVAGVIVLFSTFFIGEYVRRLNVQRESLNIDSLYILSVLMGSSLIAVGLRIKTHKNIESKNSAN
jgi:hypothetical protein